MILVEVVVVVLVAEVIAMANVMGAIMESERVYDMGEPGSRAMGPDVRWRCGVVVVVVAVKLEVVVVVLVAVVVAGLVEVVVLSVWVACAAAGAAAGAATAAAGAAATAAATANASAWALPPPCAPVVQPDGRLGPLASLERAHALERKRHHASMRAIPYRSC